MPFVHIVVALPDGEVIDHQVDAQANTPLELRKQLTDILLPAMGFPKMTSFSFALDGNAFSSSSTNPLSSFGVKENSLIFIIPESAQGAANQQSQSRSENLPSNQLSQSELHPMLARSSASNTAGNSINSSNPRTTNVLAQRPANSLGAAASGGDFDIFNPDIQLRIEQEIKRRNVQDNLMMAIEHAPEVFGTVNLAYLNCEVNGYKFRALLDTGAQSTFMHRSLITKCNLERIFDESVKGTVMGVGTSNVLGRVHAAEIKLGDRLFLICSFYVMESLPIPPAKKPQQDGNAQNNNPESPLGDSESANHLVPAAIFGIDMLRRHQAVIDFKQNALVIQDTLVPFDS